jgi:PBSX family phage terminase large subunit
MSSGLILPPIDQRVVKPYGAKARAFCKRPVEQDAWLNILWGAVRSAKTWTLIPKIISLCKYQVPGHKIFFGVSKQTIYNNVLSDLFSIVGERNYSYNRNSGDLWLMGAKWMVIGAKDEGSEKYVRGLTGGVAVGDELVLLPKSFIDMLITRMSPKGARLYATTNPDSPYHYVYTDIINNAAWQASKSIWTESFTLDDNPNLEPEYKERLISGYSGVFKLRYIEGLWVVAEGAIYKDAWSDSLLYDASERPDGLLASGMHADRFIGMDYGTVHPHVYLDVIDDGVVLWYDREYSWDSARTTIQKTDAQYADDLEEFMKPAADAQVIVPPECASFKAELVQRGIWHTDAVNDVMDGIRKFSNMMTRRRIRVRVNQSCRNKDVCVCGQQCCVRLAREIPTYAWDATKAKRGIEEPIKKNDDHVDAARYPVATKIPDWRLAA